MSNGNRDGKRVNPVLPTSFPRTLPIEGNTRGGEHGSNGASKVTPDYLIRGRYEYFRHHLSTAIPGPTGLARTGITPAMFVVVWQTTKPISVSEIGNSS